MGVDPARTERGGYGETLFEPWRPGEGERIDLGALAYDGATRRRLLAVGAGPGTRCLEIGAGTGTVARWLAEEAGVAEVLAVDRDVRFLEPHAGGALRTLAADVTAPGFDPDRPDLGRFDLVHARFVLMHVPEHRRLAAGLCEFLAPGGHLVLGDAVDLTSSAPPETPYRLAMRAMWRALRETIGTDVSRTPRYPRLLAELGLTDVGAEITVPPLTADSPITAFWLDTWRRSRPAMLATGLVTPDRLARAERALAEGTAADLSPGLITAWGRRG
ncbi:class I SAM-dependent methyltransferase [Kitasatospora sp. DSM 101779]|uniref:class I SAM-dependent methyltransferase n=1 Tax=Kitasatospora sp. DSM 101779 TaxID=2853165 RepID=UPI0021D9E8FE|nr:class I SAM-dependent methyltransferase [Kitasatospora sp. DSM 101779]MCU7821084.1 class I SAM-dependent methyltransferase [Kitasatospora sp. DSM 101779]